MIGATAWGVVGDVRDAFRGTGEWATTMAFVDSRTLLLVEVASHVLVAPTKRSSFFQSICALLAVLNALLTEISVLGDEKVRGPMAAANRMYARLDIAWDGSDHGPGVNGELGEKKEVGTLEGQAT